MLVALVLLAACGDEEPKTSDPATTTSTSEPPTTETSSVETVSAVLASRIRGEFPGVHDTVVTVDGDHMRIEFTVGEGETPGDASAFGQLAASELQTIAPEMLDDIDDVTVVIQRPDEPLPVEETFILHGQLLPIP